MKFEKTALRGISFGLYKVSDILCKLIFKNIAGCFKPLTLAFQDKGCLYSWRYVTLFYFIS